MLVLAPKQVNLPKQVLAKTNVMLRRAIGGERINLVVDEILVANAPFYRVLRLGVGLFYFIFSRLRI